MPTASAANVADSIRDTEMLQEQIRRYRTLQSKVKKACFIQP